MKQRQKQRMKDDRGYAAFSGKDSDNSAEENELPVRKPQREPPTMEKIVEDGDSLQALSIRYHCSISELKRLNNMDKENEIFARRTIKVPAHLLSMALAGVHVSGSASPVEQTSPSKRDIDADVLECRLSETLCVPGSSTSKESDFNEVIFNSNIIAIKPVEDVSERVEHEIDDEEINLLPEQAVISEPVVTRLSCSGADADISWIALFICVVIVIFAVPIIYVIYIAEHPEQYNHEHHKS